MKKLLVLLGLIFISQNVASAADVPTTSRVSQVTVYSSNAFVTRSSKVALNPGDTRVVFADILPEIDENSLRVKGKGTAEVKILGVQVKREYTKETPAERVQQLQAQIQVIEDQNAKLTNEKKILAEEKQYLDSIRLFAGQKIPEDLVTKMPSAAELDATLGFLDVKLKANFDRDHEIDLVLRENNKKLEVLRRELQEIAGSGGQKMKRSIVVEIEVVKPGELDLDVSYMVYGASWEAVYDARTDFEKGEVELVSYGVVRQNSGENWEDVSMTLSTARVSSSGSMPEVNSWFIHPYQPPVPRSMGFADSAMSRVSSKREEKSRLVQDQDMLKAAPMEAVNEYAQTETKGVSVIYKLTRSVTVKTDGSDYKLPITAQILKANFEYSAYPRAAVMAYLRSRVNNAKDLQLLGGRVNVFLDGEFVGTSRLENTAPSQEFDLYLGADENVKIQRELLEKKSDDVLLGGIPSPTRKMIYKYKLMVENYKSKKTQVSLFEAIPVSQDERIKVKISQLNTEPKQKDWKDKKGIWMWEFLLDPKAKQEIFYTSTVEFPREMQVAGLD